MKPKEHPFIIACKNNDIKKVAKMLQGSWLKSPINPNVKSSGKSALAIAAGEGHEKIVELLIKAGADVNAGEYTPLMEAGKQGNSNIIMALIAAGAKKPVPSILKRVLIKKPEIDIKQVCPKKKNEDEVLSDIAVCQDPELNPHLPKKKVIRKPDPLEMAQRKDWEVKHVPSWQAGDEILGTYIVKKVISGGMGHVYIADHKKWNIKLALKSPNKKMLSNKNLYARILREANSWIELGLHPNIAYCYYVRNIEKVPHIIMEYVDGGNLRQWIEDGKCIDYRVNLDIAIQFCHGMEYAHSKGMIHRDIKPENILMTKEGTLKITDFGLVRQQGNDQQQTVNNQKADDHQSGEDRLTAVGTFMGTEGYIAPEQALSAGEVDERADIFSFGVCLYEMFCGDKPYKITYGSMQNPPDPQILSRDLHFPSGIGAVLTKSVQWNPDDRYLNFQKIRQELLDIYQTLFREEYLLANLELISPEADGLNNRGVSYLELGQNEKGAALLRHA